MSARAFITGLSGLAVTPRERGFLREAQPWGLILFRRNCQDPDQVRALVSDFRNEVGRADAPVLIDQEGGRVQRLGPPHWRRHPAARRYGELYEQSPERGLAAAHMGARMIAEELVAIGVNVDCLPLIDLTFPGAHEIIGERAYSSDPSVVADLGRAVCRGLLDGGVLPVVKHMPGHGRATADSHHALPYVDASLEEMAGTDFVPFHALRDQPIAMTAHIVYRAIDPSAPATVSPTVINEVIRGRIGFAGLLLSDDLSMRALTGSLGARTQGALAAGCDIALHCNGDLAEMVAVAGASPALAGQAARRAETALGMVRSPKPFDRAGAQDELETMFASLG